MRTFRHADTPPTALAADEAARLIVYHATAACSARVRRAASLLAVGVLLGLPAGLAVGAPPAGPLTAFSRSFPTGSRRFGWASESASPPLPPRGRGWWRR
ncbi:MAG: hypothetical protein ACLPSH_04660 [Vulcanimicrobiaceae bacterium]